MESYRQIEWLHITRYCTFLFTKITEIQHFCMEWAQSEMHQNLDEIRDSST